MISFEFDSPCLGRVRRSSVRSRLYCLPFPGGAASAFLGWADLLPSDVELCAIQLPGREDRFTEPALTSMAPLIDELIAAISAEGDAPFALFGHSGGALFAFELARALRARRSVGPIRLFVSAEPAPDLSRSGPVLHRLGETEFIQRLRARGGTPPEIAENDELMELILPVLRADFTWYETYEYHPEAPLACPITAFAGRDDPIVDADAVVGWGAHTSADFELHQVDGGHFFVRDALPAMMPRIVESLGVGSENLG